MTTADRKFTYESINEYYTTKLSKFGGSGDLLLDDEETIGTISSNDELVKYFEDRAEVYKLDIPDCKLSSYTWLQLIEDNTPDTDTRVKLWKFRDFVFCTTMLWIGSRMIMPNTSHIFERDTSLINIDDNMFTVIGSQELISDIDVTIQGPYSWTIIAILEDLHIYLSTKGISIKCWDVEFYGDFRILKSIYLNVNRFSTGNMLKILTYAYVSYFRSNHITDTPSISDIARTLGLIYLKIVGIEESTRLDKILEDALNIWKAAAPHGDREEFYRQSQIAEEVSNDIKSTLIEKNGSVISNNTRIVDEGLASLLFFALAEGNIHRPESYILPSTAVHVVEMEQVRQGIHNNSPIPSSWFSNNARVELNNAIYIASAIEQIGYIEHYHPKETKCLKKGVKYFGRLIRAFEYSGLLYSNSEFKFIYQELNAYRKGTHGVDPGLCKTINIHNLLSYFNEYLKFHILEDTTQQNALNAAHKKIGYKYSAASAFKRRSRSSNTFKQQIQTGIGVKGGRRLSFKKTLKRRKY
jgi:hypothetical protein